MAWPHGGAVRRGEEERASRWVEERRRGHVLWGFTSVGLRTSGAGWWRRRPTGERGGQAPRTSPRLPAQAQCPHPAATGKPGSRPPRGGADGRGAPGGLWGLDMCRPAEVPGSGHRPLRVTPQKRGAGTCDATVSRPVADAGASCRPVRAPRMRGHGDYASTALAAGLAGPLTAGETRDWLRGFLRGCSRVSDAAPQT